MRQIYAFWQEFFLLGVRAQHRPEIRHEDGAGQRLVWDIILLVGSGSGLVRGNRVRPDIRMPGQGHGDRWGEAGQNQQRLSVFSGPLSLFYNNNLRFKKIITILQISLVLESFLPLYLTLFSL